MIAKDIIDAARDFAITGSELQVTDIMMLRALARAERAIYTLVIPINEDSLAEVEVFDASAVEDALNSEDSPLVLPEFYSILEGTVTYGDGFKPKSPLFLIPARMKGEMPEYHPAAYLIGRAIQPVRRHPHLAFSDEWQGVESIAVRYTPRPRPPKRLNDTLTLPDMAEDYLVMALADFMLISLGEQVESVSAQHIGARDGLVAALINLDATTTWTVRDLG